jgi:imidazolonepropionase-like amidohydrolase
MGRIIFTDANLLDGHQPAQPDSTVVVEDERIVQVSQGNAPESRPDDRVVPLAGKTLMPGLASCHFHATFRQVTLVGAPELGLEYPPAFASLIGADNLKRAITSGVTSVACSSTSYDIDASLKRAVEEELIPGPRMLCGSHELMATADIASGRGRSYWMEIGGHGTPRLCDGVEGVAYAVRDEISVGAEIVKLSVSHGHNVGVCDEMMNFTRAELESAASTAHAYGKRVRAHASSKLAVLECARAGFDIIDHADKVDEDCVEPLLQSGSFVVPGSRYLMAALAVYESGAFDTSGLPPSSRAMFQATVASMREELENISRMLPKLEAAGVKIATGDDYGTPFVLHGEYAKELTFYVKQVGIAPLDVIRWATLRGAELMGLADDLGTVAEGKLADLLVVDGDPLSDIACLENPAALLAIVKGGVFVKDSLAVA